MKTQIFRAFSCVPDPANTLQNASIWGETGVVTLLTG